MALLWPKWRTRYLALLNFIRLASAHRSSFFSFSQISQLPGQLRLTGTLQGWKMTSSVVQDAGCFLGLCCAFPQIWFTKSRAHVGPSDTASALILFSVFLQHVTGVNSGPSLQDAAGPCDMGGRTEQMLSRPWWTEHLLHDWAHLPSSTSPRILYSLLPHGCDISEQTACGSQSCSPSSSEPWFSFHWDLEKGKLGWPRKEMLNSQPVHNWSVCQWYNSCSQTGCLLFLIRNELTGISSDLWVCRPIIKAIHENSCKWQVSVCPTVKMGLTAAQVTSGESNTLMNIHVISQSPGTAEQN